MTKRIAVIITVLACMASVACDTTSPAPIDVLYVVGEDGNFRRIATALNLVPPGSIIEVRRGTYAERVVIDKPGIRTGGPVLKSLDSLEQFRAAFNRDVGVTRVVLLLSPT